MATYRHIQINYWQDVFILDLTPEEKYFYIYLMTNSKTTQCGIYEIHKKIIETETGYNRETVEKLLNRFKEYKKIVYCEETGEIFLNNWIKHNKIVSPKVKKCIEKELQNIKSKELINLFLNECRKYGYSFEGFNIDTTMDSVSIPILKVEENYNNHYGEKEKQKQKEEEKEKYKEKETNSEYVDNKYLNENLNKFKSLYEENVGHINQVVAEWLIKISEEVDHEMFKRAIEIATDNGKCHKGYINGILKKWRENNINSISDLKANEVSMNNRGVNNGKYKDEYRKPKPATDLEKEDESLYKKPTPEQLEDARRFLEEIE